VIVYISLFVNLFVLTIRLIINKSDWRQYWRLRLRFYTQFVGRWFFRNNGKLVCLSNYTVSYPRQPWSLYLTLWIRHTWEQLVENKLEIMGKAVVMAWLREICRHLSGDTEGVHEHVIHDGCSTVGFTPKNSTPGVKVTATQWTGGWICLTDNLYISEIRNGVLPWPSSAWISHWCKQPTRLNILFV